MAKSYEISVYKQEGIFLKSYKLLRKLDNIAISEVEDSPDENILEIKIHEWNLHFGKKAEQQFEEITEYFNNKSDIFFIIEYPNQNEHIVLLNKISDSQIVKGALILTVKAIIHAEEVLIRNFIQKLEIKKLREDIFEKISQVVEEKISDLKDELKENFK